MINMKTHRGWPAICILLLAQIVHWTVVQGRNATGICAPTMDSPRNPEYCQERLEAYLGDITKVFSNEHPMIWNVRDEQQILQLCRTWRGMSGTAYASRGKLSPKPTQLMSEGLDEMMDYILCEEEGIKGYLLASDCLADTDVQGYVRECYNTYDEYLVEVPYDSLDGNDDLTHQHCDVFKEYQNCRGDVFRTNCSAEIDEWANKAFVKYYDKYMENVYCDIDGGLTTKEIIFITIGCIGGLLVLFCVCFCARTMCYGATSKSQLRPFSKKKKNAKGEAITTERNGVVNKGFTKDVENGMAQPNRENGDKKGRPGEGPGYYNTQELENNNRNELEDRRRQGERDYQTDDRRSRDYLNDGRRGDRREDRYRDDRDRYERDYRDYPPRGSPRGSPRYFPKAPKRRASKQKSYDEMFEMHMHGIGMDPPPMLHDPRGGHIPHGLRRY